MQCQPTLLNSMSHACCAHSESKLIGYRSRVEGFIPGFLCALLIHIHLVLPCASCLTHYCYAYLLAPKGAYGRSASVLYHDEWVLIATISQSACTLTLKNSHAPRSLCGSPGLCHCIRCTCQGCTLTLHCQGGTLGTDAASSLKLLSSA